MITGPLFPLATALSIVELIMPRLMADAHTPMAMPYGNSIFWSKINNEITAVTAATIIVYLMISFFNLRISFSLYFCIHR